MSGLLTLLFACSVLALAPTGPWDDFNYAPASRTVYPTAVYKTTGDTSNEDALLEGDTGAFATISGEDSFISLDFGIEVGGLISLNFGESSDDAQVSLAFTESPSFVRPHLSDDSAYPSINTTYDGALYVTPSEGYWTQPEEWLRGGFRYLTIATVGDSSVDISNVSCYINFDPDAEDLRAYTGYFYAKDNTFDDEDFLTKLWYAGAYTIQTNIVPLNTGRQIPSMPAGSWANNASLGVAGPIIVDGAKRDRAVWPGDMGIAVPTQLVSKYDLISVRNALATMFRDQNPETGALPESGPPLSQLDSDTYHAWTLIGTYNYYLYTEDIEWLQEVWANYTKAVAFLEAKVDPEVQLMNVTGLRDWARLGGGGFNAEGNALLYHTLTTASALSSYINETDLSSAYAANATTLKTRFNEAFWDDEAGMYNDNLTTTLRPQDANSFAILYNLTETDEQNKRISEGLMDNWNELGAVAPELPDTISPFIGSFEIQAHFLANEPSRALDLIRREWGYMLTTNLSVQSTLLEGFTANGSLWYRSYRGYYWDPAYTSHAHGWSSGPTSSLTFHLLGLSLTKPLGREWSLKPIVEKGMGVEEAQGGFETSLGWFGANWTMSEDGSTFDVGVSTPQGTKGIVMMPNGEEYEMDGGEATFTVTF